MTINSKKDVDRLGDKIRSSIKNIDDDTIITLQEYRKGFQAPLATVFPLLCKIAKKIHYSSIATYRLKRFESIINKLERYPKMRFNRMWDIGGCRIILNSEKAIYETVEEIDKNPEFEILKKTDYIITPQEDGYKSVHLYIKHKSSDLPIEIQIRTDKQHNWATLVEITDLVYGTRLKEIGNNAKLKEFHRLLSDVESLTTREKHYVFNVLNDYKYFKKLNEVFIGNFLEVRKQWVLLESKGNHKYFLIEVSKDNKPKLTSYPTFEKAEDAYFNLYKTNNSSNIVLTYIQNHSFELLAKAYANYVLTSHTFMYDCLAILESLILDYLKNRNFVYLYQTYHFYNEVIFNFHKKIIKDIEESIDLVFQDVTDKERGKLRKKSKLWRDDIKNEIEKLNSKRRNFAINLYRLEGAQTNPFYKSTHEIIFKYCNWKFRRKTNRHLNTSKYWKQNKSR